MVDRVREKIKYTTQSWTKYLDSVFQKESANQKAVADLALDDGTVIQKAVPATVLLGLESKLKEIRGMYESVPTLAPGENWEKDPKTGEWKAVSERLRTIKEQTPVVMVQPTQFHPAQVQMVTKDVRTGRIVTTKQSSLFTPAEKSAVLGRVDDLIRAVKRARMRANNVEVDPGAIGDKLFNYIHKDIVS
jgi:hypothetical protein